MGSLVGITDKLLLMLSLKLWPVAGEAAPVPASTSSN